MAAASHSESASPIIIFVPGAWHSPTHYALLFDKLKQEGFHTLCEKNPSYDSRDPENTSVVNDAAAIRNSIVTQLDQGLEVVVIMHSYGGCPGAAAAQGLSKSERQAAQKPGGVIGLIFICAFVAKEGDSLVGKLPGGVPEPWMISQSDGTYRPDNPKAVFYEDVPSPEDSVAISQIRPQARRSMNTPSSQPAWRDAAFDGRRSYLYCLKDKAIPHVAQKAMIEESGVDWDLGTLDCAHSPFLSHPAELSTWIGEQLRSFAAFK
ncbi:hypothetical protein ACLMJK_000154 [Lecanora helva]